MSDKEFEKIYEEYNENLESAPESVKKAYQMMWEGFETYLCAVEEWTFRTAFEFGCDYAAKAESKKGGIVA